MDFIKIVKNKHVFCVFEKISKIYIELSDFLEQKTKLLKTEQSVVDDFTKKLSTTEAEVKKLSSVDISELVKEFDQVDLVLKDITETKGNISTLTVEINHHDQKLKELKNSLSSIESDNCPTCEQTWPDAKTRSKLRKDLQNQISTKEKEVSELKATLSEHQTKLVSLQKNSIISGPFKTRTELESVSKNIAILTERLNNYEQQIKTKVTIIKTLEKEIKLVSIEVKETEHNIEQLPESVFEDMLSLDKAKNSLENSIKESIRLKAEVNPYLDSIQKLEQYLSIDIDKSKLNLLESEVLHNKTLETLLSKKDSPIRRAILGSWLSRLNDKLHHYAIKLGLTYSLAFRDDLSADITRFGVEMDIGDLSGGETERVALALNWAFRDIFEEMHHKIEWAGIDERLDNGLSGAGVKKAMDVLHEMCASGRTIWLISHRKDIIDWADQVVIVRKEGEFSSVIQQ